MGIVSAMMQVGAAIKHAVAALFKVTHSLRFDGSSDHMTRTFGTPTNQTTWTLSFWFKRSRFGIREMLFATPGGTNQLYFDFLADNTMHVNDYVNSSSSNFKLVTNQTFTDNDWHHAVLMLDGSGNSPATKSKLFIDGVDLSTTSGLSTHTHTNISSFWNSANVVHYIGQYETGTLRFDGQLAEIHFIDGQALDASYFGETRNSQWVPKEVTGLNYGTNGFYLPFSTPSSTTNAFNSVTYSGSNGTQAVTGVGMQPDLVWLKSRHNTYVHGLFDTVRGAGYHLMSHLTNGNIYQSANGYLDSFDADGFTLIENPSNTGVAQTWNDTGQDYIAWTWKAGGAPTATNSGGQTPTSGSVMVDGVASTAQLPTAGIYPRKMSVNTEAGFSIVQWSGNEANNTVPHGLNSAPELIVFKSLLTGNWIVGSDYLDNTAGWNKQLYLDLPNGVATSQYSFNNTAPTSDTFSLGISDATNDTGTDSMIAYCWHSVPGYSKIGSYTGNGSTNGPKVNCGFRPAFLMIKNVSAGNSHWIIYDNARNPQTDATKKLGANENYEENDVTFYGSDSVNIDLLADGFHITAQGINHNNSGNTYLFMAFADTSPNLGLDATTDGKGVTLLLDGEATPIVDTSSNTSSNVQVGSSVSIDQNVYKNGLGSINFTADSSTNYVSATFPELDGDFTIELWAKPKSASTSSQFFMDGRAAVATNYPLLYINSSNQISFWQGGTQRIASSAISNTNWKHVAVVRAGTILTLYVDGASIGTYDEGTVQTWASGTVYIGRRYAASGSNYLSFDGYIDDFRLTAGIARDIAAEWTAGTYNSALTNDNTWSNKPQNNFAVNGAITPDDQLLDSPNLRFATLNPDDAASGAVLSNANLTAGELGSNTPVRATQGQASGKWYFEFRATSGTMNDHVGVWDTAESLGTSYVGQTAGSWSIYLGDSRVRNNSVDNTSYASGAWTSGQVGMIAMDLDNGKIYFGRDGTWFSSGDPAQQTNPAFTNLTGTLAAAATGRDTTTFNFGQDHTFAGALAPLSSPFTDSAGNGEFYYLPPLGFKALATSY